MRYISNIDSLFRGNIFRSIDTAASGMTAQRKRMDAISSNIANMSVTNADGNGNPYLRRHVNMNPDPRRTFSEILSKVSRRLKTTSSDHIRESISMDLKRELTPLVDGQEVEIPNMRKNVIFDPSHPDADADGFVTYPDVNIVEELTDLMIAQRTFDANVTVVNAAKQMIMRSLDI